MDDSPLSSPYVVEGVTVEFKMDLGGGPVDPLFEAVGGGGTDSGFFNLGVGSLFDTADPGFEGQLGGFFIRTPTTGASASLTITYTSISVSVTAASGEIWDIDGSSDGKTERWRVEAFNGSDVSLGVLLSPIGTDTLTPLDGEPRLFSFSGLDDLRKIEITFVGTKTANVGMAFNNFSPVTAVPIPAAFLLLPSALALLFLKRRHLRLVQLVP